MFAPIFSNMSTRSMTSGSTAAFVMIVVPFARHAAIVMFSVAPTETFGKWIFAPWRPPSASNQTQPFWLFGTSVAPIFFRATIWKSTGRPDVWIRQPPGPWTFASENRAMRGPKTVNPPRVGLYSLSGLDLAFSAFKTNVWPSPLTLTPNALSSAFIVSTSLILGTFFSFTSPFVNRQAAIRGRAAFFAPEIWRRPFVALLPEIMSWAISSLLLLTSVWPKWVWKIWNVLCFYMLVRGLNLENIIMI